MKEQKEDKTSLGRILTDWGLVKPEQLDRALQEQQTLRGDDLLGRLLVAAGACTEADISEAMVAQASLRAAGKHQSAMAVADLALRRKRRDSIQVRRDNLIQKGEQVRKTITNDAYPAITSAMLVKQSHD